MPIDNCRFIVDLNSNDRKQIVDCRCKFTAIGLDFSDRHTVRHSVRHSVRLSVRQSVRLSISSSKELL
jgi:hypothetical protein